jgi:hypothetical protein
MRQSVAILEISAPNSQRKLFVELATTRTMPTSAAWRPPVSWWPFPSAAAIGINQGRQKPK